MFDRWVVWAQWGKRIVPYVVFMRRITALRVYPPYVCWRLCWVITEGLFPPLRSGGGQGGGALALYDATSLSERAIGPLSCTRIFATAAAANPVQSAGSLQFAL